MAAPVVVIEGAESSGKSTLARALAGCLAAPGRKVVCVDEHLRSFCTQHRRTPRVHEQAGIAARQDEAIAQAADGAELVIADTSGLMTAVYSEVIFADPSLYAEALGRRRADLTLVTGLDLPWVADGHQRDGPAVQGHVDAALRRALGRLGLAHAVVYGSGTRRTAAALGALAQALPAWQREARQALETLGEAPAATRRWRQRCADCLQPDCEHLRLLP